mgnify:CR=1 FL=1
MNPSAMIHVAKYMILMYLRKKISTKKYAPFKVENNISSISTILKGAFAYSFLVEYVTKMFSLISQ